MLLILRLDLSNSYDLSFVTYVDRNKWRLFLFLFSISKNKSKH